MIFTYQKFILKEREIRKKNKIALKFYECLFLFIYLIIYLFLMTNFAHATKHAKLEVIN